MNRLVRFLLVICVLTLAAMAALAQRPTTTPARPTTTAPVQTTKVTTGTKVGVIFPAAFDDPKQGILKYVTAMNSVEATFRKELDELNGLVTRIQTLEKELVALKQQLDAPQNPAVPVNRTPIETSFNTKSEEYGKLGREHKFKQDDLKARFQKKQQEVMAPVLIDIGKAVDEFGKKNGFSIILDGGKLQEYGFLLGLADGVDVTREFIAFYNARPATPVTK